MHYRFGFASNLHFVRILFRVKLFNKLLDSATREKEHTSTEMRRGSHADLYNLRITHAKGPVK